jgi:hydroxymethylpyrimidine pyrophosphatase-like HAD family hydrolase
MPVQLISTDFDGTIFSEFENPPVVREFQEVISACQARGAKWVINTGRDMSSLMETLGRAHLKVRPDFLVLVERELYRHDGVSYVGVDPWNRRCTETHAALFARVHPDVPRLTAWINERFDAMVYEDAFSPFCLIARENGEADAICAYLTEYCRTVPKLSLVRNDVYARLSHDGYSKGTALQELTRMLGLTRDQVFAAGDHLNDLPMLRRDVARWLLCPGNAEPEVRAQVKAEGGEVSELAHGFAVAAALRRWLTPGDRSGTS